ncbi:MAG TPA: hypothetical protein VGO00_25125, partial [Kofleriaceae bacterium]|nr:hypothetical protein [Kofleriaceae bacterium]
GLTHGGNLLPGVDRRQRGLVVVARDDDGGGDGGGAVCTTGNPSGAAQPKQFFENSHAGPSTNDRVMNSTNTLTSRGMSMLNDGRPSMPAQW